MKNSTKALTGLIAGSVICFACSSSCNRLPDAGSPGYLSWNFAEQLAARSISEIPDTDSFILKIRNSSGTTLYEGLYGDSPESMALESGTYTVKVISREFSAPAFSSPQFGDEQVVVVQSGMATKVNLHCTQLNSGLRLRVTGKFRERYPSGYLLAESSGSSLKYSSSENRTGYFLPGNISISLNDGSSVKKLTTRYLEACEILTLGVSCPAEDSPESHVFSISVDTARVWYEDSYTIGSGSGAAPGSTMETAFSVSQAKENIDAKDVWVCGYIVGGDMTSSKTGISFEPPFTSATNIAIASRSSVSDKSSCLSVKLVSGEIRNALNLVDNPSLLGRKVYLKGDLVSAYYGIPGIQNISEYSF